MLLNAPSANIEIVERRIARELNFILLFWGRPLMSVDWGSNNRIFTGLQASLFNNTMEKSVVIVSTISTSRRIDEIYTYCAAVYFSSDFSTTSKILILYI
jgi:hypothetical protein